MFQIVYNWFLSLSSDCWPFKHNISLFKCYTLHTNKDFFFINTYDMGSDIGGIAINLKWKLSYSGLFLCSLFLEGITFTHSIF